MKEREKRKREERANKLREKIIKLKNFQKSTCRKKNQPAESNSLIITSVASLHSHTNIIPSNKSSN